MNLDSAFSIFCIFKCTLQAIDLWVRSDICTYIYSPLCKDSCKARLGFRKCNVSQFFEDIKTEVVDCHNQGITSKLD